jgi:hypothetical protein
MHSNGAEDEFMRAPADEPSAVNSDLRESEDEGELSDDFTSAVALPILAALGLLALVLVAVVIAAVL